VLARRNRRESRFPAMKPILFASSLPIPVLRPRYNPTENDLFVRRLACTGQVDDRKAYTSGRYNPTENDLYVPPSIGSLLAGRRDSRPPVVPVGCLQAHRFATHASNASLGPGRYNPTEWFVRCLACRSTEKRTRTGRHAWFTPTQAVSQ
jgi:hypothetical protein